MGSMKMRMGLLARAALTVGMLAIATVVLAPRALADDAAAQAKELKRLERELRELRADRAHDRQVIEKLKQTVDQMQGQTQQLKSANAQVKSEQTKTAQQVTDLEGKVKSAPSPAQFSQAIGSYFGTHTFDITGAAGVDFIYNQQSGALNDFPHQSQNTFLADWEPMILYRPNDWMLFQGVISTAFGATGTGTDLSTADFQVQMNDYLTLVGGLFDQPFGDWYETQSPMWTNRFVSAPLPFGVEPVVPPGEMGLQFRGGLQWGALGQDFDYTVWVGDGASYSEPVAGAAVSSPTSVAFAQTNGKSYGARLRVYPLPVDANWGRLELGASTYNSKWSDGSWFNSWGVDYNYFIGNLQTRGEWMQGYRQISGGPADNRQGWYIQAGYFLNGVHLPFGPEVNKIVQRMEPLVRYSGVNQHYVAIDDIAASTGVGMGGIQTGLVPDFGLNGSPALWAPHSREVAIGLDYWIAPSIVWQNEFDIELPEAGGIFVAGDGSMSPVGAVPNDRAFLTQFTIGF